MAEASELNRDELVEELTEANRRLSGTLRVVLGTLDAPDVPTLFSRVLEALRETVDAAGAILYLAEAEGFRLQAASSSMEGERIPVFLPHSAELRAVTLSRSNPFGLHLVAPSAEDLRQGQLEFRELESDRDGTRYRVPARYLLPFTSFIMVPVWFGGHVIALISVGWSQRHRLRRSDGELLDAVARYLSVQLAGALTSMRNERSRELDAALAELAGALSAADELDVTATCNALSAACHELGGSFVLVEPGTDGASAVFAEVGRQKLPEGFSLARDGGGDGCTVEPILAGSELSLWLEGLGQDSRGALVDVGTVGPVRLAFMVLKPLYEPPLEELELGFLRRAGEAVRGAAEGRQERAQDRRIAQALQQGMRSTLQEVEGIDAEAAYSSATADAFVGGDFYDLIRLPGRRACVIMGDVSGKGVEAASVSAGVRTALGAYAWQNLSPAHMVRTLNRYLLGFSRVETFATLFVGMIDLEKGRMAYCSAGHPPALVLRSTDVLEALDVQSGMVGAFDDMSYRDGYLDLSEGDLLLLYTDGATEARNPEREFLGEEGLSELVLRLAARKRQGLAGRLLDAIDSYTGHRLDDDVALVSLVFEKIG